MANIKSAKKAARKSEKRRVINLARKTSIKTAVKKLLASIEGGDATQTQSLLRDVTAKLARAQSKGVIHSKTASRKISRLAQRVAATQAEK
jgi:small subunit ribosomal protein S20